MRVSDRSGRTVGGCLVLALIVSLIIGLVPAALLMAYGEPRDETKATPELTSVYQAVHIRGRDAAWVKAEAHWAGSPARPQVTLTSRSIPWARAEGEVIEPKTPGDVPMLRWELRVGLLGFVQRYEGVTPLPTPVEE